MPVFWSLFVPTSSKNSSAGLAQWRALPALTGGLNMYPKSPPLPLQKDCQHTHTHTLKFGCTLWSPALRPICTTLLLDCESAAKSSSVGQQWCSWWPSPALAIISHKHTLANTGWSSTVMHKQQCGNTCQRTHMHFSYPLPATQWTTAPSIHITKAVITLSVRICFSILLCLLYKSCNAFVGLRPALANVQMTLW